MGCLWSVCVLDALKVAFSGLRLSLREAVHSGVSKGRGGSPRWGCPGKASVELQRSLW